MEKIKTPSSKYFQNELKKQQDKKESSDSKDLVPLKKNNQKILKQNLRKISKEKLYLYDDDKEITSTKSSQKNSLPIDGSISLRIVELRKRFQQTVAISLVLVFFSATPISFLSLFFLIRARSFLEDRNPDSAEAYLDRAFTINLFSLVIGSLILLSVISIAYPSLRREFDKVKNDFKSI